MPAHVGVYPLMLRAEVDGLQKDVAFKVTISDPCNRAILQPSSPLPLVNQVLIRNFDTTKTQTVTVSSDLEQTYGIQCAFSASLVSPPAWATISGSTITLDESKTVAGDVGSTTITVLVDSQLYPSQVIDLTYTFTVDI